MHPKVTIVIPNFNYAHYLPECLDSILLYALPEAEIVIIDDASTDNSLKIIQEYAKKDARIRVFQNKQNLGLSFNCNLGLKEGRGEFFSFIASDDKLVGPIYEQAIPLLEKNKGIGICCSDFTYFYEGESTIRKDGLYPTKLEQKFFSPKEVCHLFKTTKFWIPSHTSIFRGNLIKKYGGFRKELNLFLDFYLAHKIALVHGAAYIPRSFCAMRLHKNSYSMRTPKNRETQRKAAISLLHLINQDPYRKEWKKSTILRFVIKSNLISVLVRPRFWKYFFPAFIRYMLKVMHLLK